MNLVFRFPQPKNDVGEVYLVDSPPFQQGTFEIELHEKSDFYAAALWRKTGDGAEPPAKITVHHIRGRVLDAATKKPISGAKIQFQTAPGFYGENSRARFAKSELKTDADGRFALERLRGDLLDQTRTAAVFVEYADYAVGNYVEIFAPSEEQYRLAAAGNSTMRFQSRDDLTIELTPLVTISGQIVDGKSGAQMTGAETFKIGAEYGKRGYVGGNLSIPPGESKVAVRSDGTFVLRTAPGENRVSGTGKINGKEYVLSDSKLTINVGADGAKDVILKIERAPFELIREVAALGKQGNEHFTAGRLEDALRSFKEAAELQPHDLRTHTAIVRVYSALKRPERSSFVLQTKNRRRFKRRFCAIRSRTGFGKCWENI